MVKGDEKKLAILDVAERLFYAKGFEDTSVQDILNVLKCSKGSFYHHFESKFSVLETLCQQRGDKAFELARRKLEGVNDIISRVNLLLYYAFPLRKGEEKFMMLLLPMVASSNGVTLCAQYSQALTECFQPALKAMMEQGEVEQVFHITLRDQMSKIICGVLNESWMELAKTMIRCKQENRIVDTGDLQPILTAYRCGIERLLDAPYGTIDIIRLPELIHVSQHVMAQGRLGI